MNDGDSRTIRDSGSYAQADDDQRWIDTVLTSQNGRSHEAKQALQQALLDGHRLNPAGLTTL